MVRWILGLLQVLRKGTTARDSRGTMLTLRCCTLVLYSRTIGLPEATAGDGHPQQQMESSSRGTGPAVRMVQPSEARAPYRASPS